MSLFEPLKSSAPAVPNRILVAPLDCVQRASARLIISEAAHIPADTISRRGTAVIHTEGQVYGGGGADYIDAPALRFVAEAVS